MNDATMEMREALAELRLQTGRLRRRTTLALLVAAVALTICTVGVPPRQWFRRPSQVQALSWVTEHLRVGKAGSKSEVQIGANDSGSVIAFVNGSGANTMNIGFNAQGQPTLSVLDPSGALRGAIGLVTDPGGNVCSLSFNNPKGETRLSLGVSSDGDPRINLVDRKGVHRMGIFVSKDDSTGSIGQF